MATHRWYKLRQRLAGITAPGLDVSFIYSPVVKKTYYSEIVLRFFQVKFEGEIIWRFPKDSKQSYDDYGFIYSDREYPIMSIIKYLDLPQEQLLAYEDEVGLADILKVCDRRIGYNRLKNLELSAAANIIFDVRFKERQPALK
jgi:hypothetical protein